MATATTAASRRAAASWARIRPRTSASPIGLGGLPLAFALAPKLAQIRLFGITLPWLLLGVFAYPFLFLVGAAYVYLAERNEQEFTDLIERRDR